jgi:hypothetical protein
MEERVTADDTALFNKLQTMRPYVSSLFFTRLEQLCVRLSRWCMVGGICGFVIMLALAGLHFLAGPLPPWLRTAGLLVCILTVVAMYGMLFGEAVATFLQVASNKVRDHHERGNFAHDLTLAETIRRYPAWATARADAWLDQQATGMERRVSVVFGKELAMVTLLTTLLTGKANEVWSAIVGSLAPWFHTSPGFVAGGLASALLFLVIGAFRVKARVARVAYLRYLIRLAAIDAAVPGDAVMPAAVATQPSHSQTPVVTLADQRAA